ncbi:CRISPR-associated helicase Cas3' [Gemmata sp. G18]|uniref:CRISPR-associated helicase Cas3 n=1 Tax=Gemmata palustris TaxID=2822762 RepID=A0ABS5BT27_9BACT|nr:CRISPR-associated helicase Cas3' [Gemmata palustris]MBP3956881.1 CRISPR-associated helicase Cas3' [Gemmata palustris]
MLYFAHSARDDTGALDLESFQFLAQHLHAVAEGAARRATLARPERTDFAAAARLAGLLHDLGKYRPEFQLYIRDDPRYLKGNSLTRHKEAGAAVAFDRGHKAVAFAIAGHHGGIPDGTECLGAVSGPNGRVVAASLRATATRDCPELGAPVPIPPQLPNGLAWDLFTRVTFSCLVDADWSDTGAHEREVKNWPAEPDPPALEPGERLARVEAFIAGRAARPLEPHVKRARAEVLAACLVAAERPSGVFTLTVPTGGGKTLAALAFALKHAARHGLRRIIYVAPYMTILEQNADAIRDALDVGAADPTVFEHYSLADPGDTNANETDLGAAARRAENWDAPVVVTTNVQFFESLFSNKPGRCRKLHNIARSVVVLDECQTLPPGLVAPTCGMLNQLATELGCSVVLCTATQPAFDHDKLAPDERLAVTEIIPPDANLFATLKRVRVRWPKPTDAALGWGEVAGLMRAQKSALCVMNTKKAARAVYDELTTAGAGGAFHLSTGMCPQHRREKLAQVRGRLAAGEPCFVVSTQLIEAGVDVDFPFLLREMAPLESVIQAAGRCNREGKIPHAGGRVVVFRSAGGKMPPDRWYNAGRAKVEQLIREKGDGPQIDDPAAIRDYFARLYHTGNLDAAGVQEMRRTFKFASVAEAYRLIADAGQPVVVRTWGAHRAQIDDLLVELAARPRKSVYRQLAPFQVNLLPAQLVPVGHLLHEHAGRVLVWDGKYDDEVGIVSETADEFIV